MLAGAAGGGPASRRDCAVSGSQPEPDTAPRERQSRRAAAPHRRQTTCAAPVLTRAGEALDWKTTTSSPRPRRTRRRRAKEATLSSRRSKRRRTRRPSPSPSPSTGRTMISSLRARRRKTRNPRRARRRLPLTSGRPLVWPDVPDWENLFVPAGKAKKNKKKASKRPSRRPNPTPCQARSWLPTRPSPRLTRHRMRDARGSCSRRGKAKARGSCRCKGR